MKQKITLFLALIFVSFFGQAQTTLAAGDIAFVMINATDNTVNTSTVNDNVSFVLLKNITSGTKIYFTDFGWRSDSPAFQTANSCGTSTGAVSDGIVEWTATSALTYGTVVHMNVKFSPTVNIGTITGYQATFNVATQYVSIATSSEAVFAYQGSISSPTLITGLNTKNAWATTLANCDYNPTASTLPSSLTTGSSALCWSTTSVNGILNSSVVLTGNKATDLANIYNPANWTYNGSVAFLIPSYTVGAADPVITSNPANRTICDGGTTTFSISASDATGYQWQVNTGSGFVNVSNGASYSGATTATLTITSATAGMSGYLYRCAAIGSSSVNSNSGALTVSSISVESGSQINISCNGGSNGSAAASPTGGIGSYSYSWSPSGGTSSIATGLMAGSYTVTVTDVIGCIATRNFVITQPSTLTATPVSQTNVSCNGGSNGAATVTTSGGTPTYTYSWSPSGGTGATASGLSAGTYTCTVTDANSCTATQSFTITQPSALIATPASQTNVSCNGGSNGAATVTTSGGTPSYAYSWSPSGGTGATASGLTVGTYTCTVTDANSCTATQSFTITQPSAISVTAASQTNIACNGEANGAASVSTPTGGTAGYTYNWTPGNPSGDGTASVTGLTAGDWTCTVTDANSCTADQTFTITQPSALPEIVTTETACGTYTWSVNGSTYTTSGTYTSVIGCQTETLNLTITPGTSNTTTETACDTYTWSVNGTTYTTSGTYTSVTGCHTETLELTITPSTPNTTTITACDTYTWSVNGTTYTTSGTYTSVTGCNTETLELTIEPSTSNTTTASACDTYTWSVNGQTYTDSGTYTSVVGCHTETLNLSLARTSIFTPSMAIATYGEVNSPEDEEYFNIIDNDVNTKFYDSASSDGTGFTVDLGGVSKIATSISVTTANDVAERDPKNYEVLGSNDGTNFTSIATGAIECNSNRFYTRNYYFVNNTAYGYYRINFTNMCSEGSVFQLSEVQLYSTSTTGLAGPIVFATQPVNTSICNKFGTVNLTAAIVPIAGATYQWKVQTATGTTWENVLNSSVHYFGARTPVLEIQQATVLMNNNKYKLVVTAPTSCSSEASSDSCVLTVDPISLTGLISGGGTICENSSKTLRISNWRTGTIQTIQWQASTVDATTGFTDIEGATGSIYTTDALTATTYYRAVITSGVCDSRTSLAVAVAVIPAPVAGTISGGNVTVCAFATSGRDLSGTETTFSNNTILSVVGSTGTILWQKSTNYENATGATPVWTSALITTNELTVTDLTSDTWFRVIATNSGCAVTSDVVKITVTKAAKAGVINSYSNGIVNSASVCTGGDVSFVSTAFTGTEIKWEVSTTSATSGFEAVVGENGQTFTMNTGAYPPLTSIYIRSVVRSGDCSTAISGFKKITISPQSVAGTVTGGGIICPGANRSVTVSGYTGAIQWQSSSDGTNFVNVPNGLDTAGTNYSSGSANGRSATFLANNITAGTYFRAIITSGACSVIYTNAVQYTIGSATVGTVFAENPTVCKGTGTTLTVTQSVGTIKWWKSTNWTAATPNWSPLSSTTATVLTGNLSVATAYKAEVTVGTCSVATSQIMPVMVFAAPLAKTITANVTSPSGTSSASAICNTSTSKVLIIGGGSIGTIQWQKSITSATSGFVDIADAIAMSYAITNPTVGANYFRAKFTNSCGVSVFSSAITVHYKDCAPGKAVASSEFGKTSFAVVSHPNPFTSNFNLDVTTSSSEKVEVLVYDMIGRLLGKHQENVSEINTLEIGTSYPAGVYNVIVTQGMEVKTVRVIKK